MLYRCLIPTVAIGFLLTCGCAGPLRTIASVSEHMSESFRFRQEMREDLAEIRERERVALRSELAALRREELRELKRATGPTAAELSATLNQNIKQRIKQTRMVVDRDAMAKRAALLAKYEENQEEMYEHELEEYLARQAEHNRRQYEWVKLRKRQLAGDPSCRVIPPQPEQFNELPPERPQPLNLSNQIIYKMELAVETGIEAGELEEAEARMVPLKERCPPEEPSCGKCGKGKACKCGGYPIQQHHHTHSQQLPMYNESPIPPRPQFDGRMNTNSDAPEGPSPQDRSAESGTDIADPVQPASFEAPAAGSPLRPRNWFR